MVITPHSLVGALAGSRERSLPGAFAAGFESHFLLDKVPHHDYSLAGMRGKALAGAEIALVAALLGCRGGRGREVAGALGGIAPDLLCLLERSDRLGLPRLFSPVHDRSHTKRRMRARPSFLLQALVAAAALALLPGDAG